MKKILVIEDDRIVRENITELLDLSGYKAASAAEGKEGIRMALEFQPDLVICDIKMPGLDGYGVLYILRKKLQTRATPVIFLTALSDKTARRKGMEMGADDYISKPVSSTVLLKAVETRLKRKETIVPPEGEEADSFIMEASGRITPEGMIRDLEAVKYEAHKVIFNPGDHPAYLYHMVEGSVKLSRYTPDGKEFISNICFKGDYFGYQPLLENRTYNEVAETLEESRIHRIPKKDFLDKVYSDKHLAARLVKILSTILTEKDDEIVQLAYDSVRKRIAAKLLELIPEDAKADDSLDITRTNLASLVGTTSETIVRTLSELREENIISKDEHGIILLDRNRLIQRMKAW